MFPLSATVGLRKRVEGEPDSRGNPTVTYEDALPLNVYGYGPRSAEGQAEPRKPLRDLVIIGMTVYGPPSLASQVSPLDRMEVPLGGDLYEVDGEVGDWSNGPFGFAPGCSITLRRAEG